MTLFWADTERGIEISYDDLVEDLTRRDERRPVVMTDDPSELYVELLTAILVEEELTVLDSDFSHETLQNLGYPSDAGSETVRVQNIHLQGPEELVDQIESTTADWSLGLYTSGTTGTPSRVEQTFEGLTRSVRLDDRFKDNVWGYAYNPTHFAGFQVFFQAILNLNPMIYLFESSPDEIHQGISEHGITHLSATPTFYRLRLKRLPGRYKTVKRLTSGGEKFEPALLESLKERFPNAAIRNVYAISEAGPLLESADETFRIPEELEERVKINNDNELIVHHSLIDTATAEQMSGEWYHTGDLVQYQGNERFMIVGRQSDFVNVAGYRVNPHEVEERINQVENVKASAVTARESSVTGNILVAQVEPEVEANPEDVEQAVKEGIEPLERWKQPRIIDIVDQLPKTRSGKRKR